MNVAGSPSTSDLARLRPALSTMSPADDAERIDRIRLLEELKSAAAAAQAKETAFVESQRGEQRVAGVPADQVGRGVATQVGWAERESPFRARRYAGWATTLTTELPATFAALQTGRIVMANQRLFLRLTGDDICATPWCDAPIRHADHIRPHELGGATTLANGQGLCEACNHAEQAPGRRHPLRSVPRSPVERRLLDLLAA